VLADREGFDDIDVALTIVGRCSSCTSSAIAATAAGVSTAVQAGN
jgi:Fe-S cluster biogenesis protein NfuA